MPALRESPRRWWLMVLLVAAMVACYAHRGALSVAAPFMINQLGLSPGVMGILLSAFFWLYSFLQVPAGWAVDRFGVRRTYAFGYAFWSLASALTGFAGSLLALVLFRMALGAGQSVAFPASARAVSNWFRQSERGTVTGAYLTGVRLGQALVSALGAWLVAAHGFRFFFLVTGLAPLVWLIPWLRFLRPWESEPHSPTGAQQRESEPRGLSFIQSVLLLRNRSVLGIFLGFFAYDYAWFVYLTWLPGYLVLERGFTTREMGIYSSVPYVAMSVIIFASGLFSDWLIRRGFAEVSVRKALIIAGLAIACLIVPAGMAEDRMVSVWLLTISLCGLGISSANTWTLTQTVCSREIVGTVSGIQNFGGNLGGILAPAVTGFIAHATHSFAMALALAGAVLVAGIFSYALLIRERVEAGS